MRSLLLGAVLVILLSGCSVFSYDLTPPLVAPLTVPPAGPIHTGRDCGVTLFGIGFGTLRIADAMQDGGILQPTKIMLDQNAVLLVGWNCLTVEGPGPGPVAPVFHKPRR
jgi:hypothetical protein